MLAILSSTAIASASTIIDLGTLPGASLITPTGINASGQVVGYADIYGYNHAFLYSGGVLTDLGGANSAAFGINDYGTVVGWAGAVEQPVIFSNGTTTNLCTIMTGSRPDCSGYAAGINDSGQITGSVNLADSSNPNDEIRAFIYSDGITTDLGTLGSYGSGSWASGINSGGQVVGYYNASGGEHAFIYSAGMMIDLGTPGSYGVANAVNDAGQVVGDYFPGNTLEPFVYAGGVLATVNNLGGGSSNAFGIDNNGDIVGRSGDVAFLNSGGIAIDLNTLLPPDSGWQLYSATAINNNGQIAGIGQIDGEIHAYILDTAPIPEPGTSMLICVVAVILLFRLKAQRYKVGADH